MLVDRGDCTFVKKVHNVEKMGGQLAIVVDSNAQWSGKVIMTDDGKGTEIHIPSYLISKAEGDLIKKTLAEGRHVVVKASLEITHPDNRVEYELWYTTA